MPWLQTNPMDERMRFVVAHKEGLFSMAELCRRFGVSRETGYTWLRRYTGEGVSGLADRSHAPHHCPHKISAEVARCLITLRRKHPRWGPVTLLKQLSKLRPELQLPAPSTAGDLLAREGLVQPRRRRAKSTPPEGRAVRTSHPSERDGKLHPRALCRTRRPIPAGLLTPPRVLDRRTTALNNGTPESVNHPPG